MSHDFIPPSATQAYRGSSPPPSIHDPVCRFISLVNEQKTHMNAPKYTKVKKTNVIKTYNKRSIRMGSKSSFCKIMEIKISTPFSSHTNIIFLDFFSVLYTHLVQ